MTLCGWIMPNLHFCQLSASYINLIKVARDLKRIRSILRNSKHSALSAAHGFARGFVAEITTTRAAVLAMGNLSFSPLRKDLLPLEAMEPQKMAGYMIEPCHILPSPLWTFFSRSSGLEILPPASVINSSQRPKAVDCWLVENSMMARNRYHNEINHGPPNKPCLRTLLTLGDDFLWALPCQLVGHSSTGFQKKTPLQLR